ncbi:IucA/IucC family protein [Paractinoplanes atraurantiacus]|uniref:Siderophore synthetase component n=1 Tax=Paractinoplanes atraurantiacus TaxID=1036182 RepID=A0A285IA29_9ACTN|nr:IucA/IucC family protein [Actinoplanes atraurantiacus]SNY44818.1 Siderophore synthetase component [Actinoplanes atraurantiacus]
MPRPIPSAPSGRHTAGTLRTREELRDLRPDLLERYDAELPGARAAVLGRLLGAVDREALPGLTGRTRGSASFARTADGRVGTLWVGRAVQASTDRHELGRHDVALRYSPEAAEPFFPGAAGLAVDVELTSFGQITHDSTMSMADPGELVRLLWGDVPFAAEVDNSVANLALARAAHTGGPQLPEPGPDALGLVEQQIVDGHPLHPCCRTRGGMSVADVLAYAPEHSPVIRLRRLAVPADRWFGDGPPVLLAHPWQADHLRDRYPWLRDDGETAPVRPLMSLRTVAPLDGSPHVKTAVDIQMTSAVRTVSPAAVHNGPLLSRLLTTLTADLPIEILAETGAGAVIVDGQPQRHLAHLFRAAPRLAPGEIAVPLAWFGAAPLPLERGDDAYTIMGLIAKLLFGPAVRLLARGVALEAHGQNTLLVLRGKRPARVLYRDLGGVRVSPRRLRAAGVEAPPLLGDLPSDDPQVLRTKLSAAALGTVAQELITAFHRWHGADRRRLWGIVAAAIRDTGTTDVPHLLRDPLPVKATTAMRLAADPLDDLWAHLDNPMAEHA